MFSLRKCQTQVDMSHTKDPSEFKHTSGRGYKKFIYLFIYLFIHLFIYFSEAGSKEIGQRTKLRD